MICQLWMTILVSAVIWTTSANAALTAVCEGIRFATFPDPHDCRQYVVCFQGKTNVQRCPAQHVFNPEVLFCVLESQMSCNEVTTPGLPESTSIEPPPPSPPTTPSTVGPGCVDRPTWESFFCQDVRRALVANPMNCTQYINCRSVPPKNHRCPPNTIYSDAYQDCLPGDERECTMATVSEAFCADQADGSYPHPYQCNRFVSCVRQRTRLEACPPFFVFDSVLCHCVEGNAVACSNLLNQ